LSLPVQNCALPVCLEGRYLRFSQFFAADFSLATNHDDVKNALVSQTLGPTLGVHSWKGITYAQKQSSGIVCIQQTNASILNLGMS
jgi:hypothetical protein